MPPTEDVQMQMRHSFAGVRTIVEYEAITRFRHTEFLGNFSGFKQKMTENFVVIRPGFGDSRDWFSRNNKDVNGRLRFDVVKCDDEVAAQHRGREGVR